MWNKVIKALCAVGGALAGIFGEWNVMLTILMISMALDYVSGFIVAACGKSKKTEAGGLSSSVGFVGLAKKALIILVVLLASLLDRVIGNSTMIFQGAAACYYIANEGLSIIENAVLIGIPVPEFIKNALEEVREHSDNGDAADDDAET